jgi:hypothetical protein
MEEGCYKMDIQKRLQKNFSLFFKDYKGNLASGKLNGIFTEEELSEILWIFKQAYKTIQLQEQIETLESDLQDWNEHNELEPFAVKIKAIKEILSNEPFNYKEVEFYETNSDSHWSSSYKFDVISEQDVPYKIFVSTKDNYTYEVRKKNKNEDVLEGTFHEML